MIQLDDTTVDALRAEIQRLQHELAAKEKYILAIARGQMERDCRVLCRACRGEERDAAPAVEWRATDTGIVRGKPVTRTLNKFVHPILFSDNKFIECRASDLRAEWSHEHKETPALKPDALAHLARDMKK